MISVNDKLWEVQTATGRDCNCLIDTVRQSLDLPASDALLDCVREDLAKELPAARGSLQVRTAQHLLGANYLEFTEHTRAVARLLRGHSGVTSLDHESLKFICCDLDTERTTVVEESRGSPHEIVFVRR